MNTKGDFNWLNVCNHVPETTGNFIALNGRSFELGFISRSHVNKKPMIWHGGVYIIIKHGGGGEYVVSSGNVAAVAGGYLVGFDICRRGGLVIGTTFNFVCGDDLNGRVFHETAYQYNKLQKICVGLNDGLLCENDYKFIYHV